MKTKVQGPPEGKTQRKNNAEREVGSNVAIPSRAAICAWLRAAHLRGLHGDDAAITTLWDALNGITGALAEITDKSQLSVDYRTLMNVVNRCQHILQVAVSRSDRPALTITLLMTEHGCRILERTAEDNPTFVSGVAEHEPFWPAMCAVKKIYQRNVENYLRKIRIGTKSAPPTVDTKVEANDRWMERAVLLANLIVTYRAALLRDRNDINFSGALRKAEVEIRRKAKQFPQVLDLDLEDDGKTLALRPDTRNKWWMIALKMLKNYWDENPAIKSADYRDAGPNSEEDPRTNAIRKVRNAFRTLAK